MCLLGIAHTATFGFHNNRAQGTMVHVGVVHEVYCVCFLRLDVSFFVCVRVVVCALARSLAAFTRRHESKV